MGQWMMYSWTYSRKPKTTQFDGELIRTLVSRFGDHAEETIMQSSSFSAVEMSEMVTVLHEALKNEKLQCKVTIFIPSKAENGKAQAWELDEPTTEILKTDLPRALELWAPRYQICVVRPYVPTLRQENNNDQ